MGDVVMERERPGLRSTPAASWICVTSKAVSFEVVRYDVDLTARICSQLRQRWRTVEQQVASHAAVGL
jgi:hypothetical protein